MAYDAALATRLRAVLGPRADVGAKPMFGGLTFMVAGHMRCGVAGDELVAHMFGWPVFRAKSYTLKNRMAD